MGSSCSSSKRGLADVSLNEELKATLSSQRANGFQGEMSSSSTNERIARESADVASTGVIHPSHHTEPLGVPTQLPPRRSSDPRHTMEVGPPQNATAHGSLPRHWVSSSHMNPLVQAPLFPPPAAVVPRLSDAASCSAATARHMSREPHVVELWKPSSPQPSGASMELMLDAASPLSATGGRRRTKRPCDGSTDGHSGSGGHEDVGGDASLTTATDDFDPFLWISDPNSKATGVGGVTEETTSISSSNPHHSHRPMSHHSNGWPHRGGLTSDCASPDPTMHQVFEVAPDAFMHPALWNAMSREERMASTKALVQRMKDDQREKKLVAKGWVRRNKGGAGSSAHSSSSSVSFKESVTEEDGVEELS